MARIPKFTIHSWGSAGPVYTRHGSLEGRRNRHLRRSGATADELLGGSLDDPHVAEPSAFMLYAAQAMEVWAFNKGHVYEIALLVDGEERRELIDAREDFNVSSFAAGIELVEYDVAPAPADDNEPSLGDDEDAVGDADSGKSADEEE